MEQDAVIAEAHEKHDEKEKEKSAEEGETVKKTTEKATEKEKEKETEKDAHAHAPSGELTPAQSTSEVDQPAANENAAAVSQVNAALTDGLVLVSGLDRICSCHCILLSVLCVKAPPSFMALLIHARILLEAHFLNHTSTRSHIHTRPLSCMLSNMILALIVNIVNIVSV